MCKGVKYNKRLYAGAVSHAKVLNNLQSLNQPAVLLACQCRMSGRHKRKSNAQSTEVPPKRWKNTKGLASHDRSLSSGTGYSRVTRKFAD